MTPRQTDKVRSRANAGVVSRNLNFAKRSLPRVLALVEGRKRKEPIMSVPDCELDEPDNELCSEHMQYRPCRPCKREAQIERAEAMKEEEQ